jgi:hypothetical protein
VYCVDKFSESNSAFVNVNATTIPILSGPNYLYNTNTVTYSVINRPANTSITWTVSGHLEEVFPRPSDGSIRVRRTSSIPTSGCSGGEVKATMQIQNCPIPPLTQHVFVGGFPTANLISSQHNGQTIQLPKFVTAPSGEVISVDWFEETIYFNNQFLTSGNSHGITQIQWQDYFYGSIWPIPSGFTNEVCLLALCTPGHYLYGGKRTIGINYFGTDNKARVKIRMQNQCGWSDWKAIEYLQPNSTSPPPTCMDKGCPGCPNCLILDPDPCPCCPTVPPGLGCHCCEDIWFMFSPNPVSDELTIDFENLTIEENKTETISVKLLDNSGRVQRENNFNHRRGDNTRRSVKFNVSNLPEGTYYLHIEYNEEIHKEQIIIKR